MRTKSQGEGVRRRHLNHAWSVMGDCDIQRVAQVLRIDAISPCAPKDLASDAKSGLLRSDAIS